MAPAARSPRSKRNDFFVKHLRGLQPPNWNDMPVTTATGNGDDEPDYEALELEQLMPRIRGPSDRSRGLQDVGAVAAPPQRR